MVHNMLVLEINVQHDETQLKYFTTKITNNST